MKYFFFIMVKLKNALFYFFYLNIVLNYIFYIYLIFDFLFIFNLQNFFVKYILLINCSIYEFKEFIIFIALFIIIYLKHFL